MIEQVLERLVTLGESEGLLACRRADLHGRLDAMELQKLSQLRVAHQVGLLIVELGHERLLLVLHGKQVSFQRVLIQPQHRLTEHADRQVHQPLL